MSAQATLTGAPAGSVIMVPACELPLRLIADLFSRCFTGYFVPVEIDAEGLSHLICAHTVDLSLSRILIADGEPAAFLLTGARGTSQRIAAMGVLSSHRRKGLARLLLQETITLAKGRGSHRLLLEVIEENEPAITLYRTRGFEISRRLVGYDREAGAARSTTAAADQLSEVDPVKVAQIVAWESDPGLPWQRSAASLFACQPATRAFRLETAAFAIITEMNEHLNRIETVLVLRAKRRQGWGTRLLDALAARCPDKNWTISATVPEDLAEGFLLTNGFTRSPIAQLEMVLDLGQPGELVPDAEASHVNGL